MNATIERKYALTRVAHGEYLLPSNDAGTVYRIARYTDGPSGGLSTARDQEFWGVWRWLGSNESVDTEGWDHWEFCEGGHRTRGEAIQGALS